MVVDNGTSGCQGTTSSLYLILNISVIYCRIEVKFVLVKAEWWWLSFGKINFYVTCGLANMTSLSFQLGISPLLYVGLNHKLVREIWIVHITLRCVKYNVSLKVTLTFWVNCNVNEYFLCFFISPFITPPILDRITSNFERWLLKKELPAALDYVINIFKLAYLRYFLSDRTQISFCKIRLMICICILTWNVIK